MICTISAIAAQIRQSQTLAEWAMALTSGSTKPSRLRPERDRRRRLVGADQLELVVRGDAGIDEEVGDHGDDRRAEIDQERRQPGEGLKDH